MRLKKENKDKIINKIIDFYQFYISPDTGLPRKIGLINKPVCVFTPSCSEYTRISIIKYGFLKGSFLGIKRILRCHPWQKNHFDPVP